MDRVLVLVGLSAAVRRTWIPLNDVSNALVELGYSDIASELTDLEVKLMNLQHEILQLASNSSFTPRRKQSSGGVDDGIPF